MKKIIIFYKKYIEIISYIFFGILTTLTNIITYIICTRFFLLDAYFSNVIAWTTSVLFAFITNKIYVFKSLNKDIRTLTKEILSFFILRIFSLAIDMLSMYLMISIFKWNDLIAKIIANIIVIILNYIFSKFIIFKNRHK